MEQLHMPKNSQPLIVATNTETLTSNCCDTGSIPYLYAPLRLTVVFDIARSIISFRSSLGIFSGKSFGSLYGSGIQFLR